MTAAHQQSPGPALVVAGGSVIDGTGAPRFSADVRIEGERIVAIGASVPRADASIIDATDSLSRLALSMCTPMTIRPCSRNRKCCPRSAKG